MNIGNLGILKKLFIILRCHKDIRKDSFVEFEYINADGITQNIYMTPLKTSKMRLKSSDGKK